MTTIEQAREAGGVAAALEAKLTAVRKALYGSAGLGFGCVEYVVAVYLLKFYTDYTVLEAKWAGLALMLGKLFDGASDPIMGYLSDRTKSRWGRRRPWFIAGAIPLTVSFVAMFSPPGGLSQFQMFWWLTLSNMLFFVGTTMVEVPHAALGSEVTKTHQERVSIMGWRQGFSSTGLFLGAVAPMVFIRASATRAGAVATEQGLGADTITAVAHAAARAAHGTMAIAFGVLVLLAFTVAFAGTREPSGPRTPPRDTIFGDFFDALRSGPFRFLMTALLFSEIAGGLTATLVLYAIGDWWGFHGHEEAMISTYLLVGIVSIPIWVRISRSFEKHHMFTVGSVMAMVALFGMLLNVRIGVWWGYAMLILTGLGFGARAVMVLALVPDIVDDDEERTHTRKDGAYFGMWSLLRKISRAVALGVCGLGLSFFGYVPGVADQSPEALRGIAVMYSIVPGVALLFGGLLLLAFPLNRASHAATQAVLEARRRAGAAAS